MHFIPFPKIPRISRDIVVTEKLDGTNASILIMTALDYTISVNESGAEPKNIARVKAGNPSSGLDDLMLLAGSRNRWLTPEDDNYGFANWVKENAEELVKLGTGHHFGEWWGKGIQRNYDLTERRFSLFNVEKWSTPESRPTVCHVVPTLYRGPFSTASIDAAVATLAVVGSLAVPGYMQPEGVVIYHTAGNLLFKKTVKGDELHKSQEGHVQSAPKSPKPKGDPSKGGRRKADLPIAFQDRRKPRGESYSHSNQACPDCCEGGAGPE